MARWDPELDLAIAHPSAEELEKLPALLLKPKRFDSTLEALSRFHDGLAEMGPLLWHTSGVVDLLIEKLTSIFEDKTRELTMPDAKCVIKIVKLFKCMFDHPESRRCCIDAEIYLYLILMLQFSPLSKQYYQPTTQQEPAEYIRIHVLEVLNSIVENADAKLLMDLYDSKAFHRCHEVMRYGSTLSQFLATLFCTNLIRDDGVMSKVCTTKDAVWGTKEAIDTMAEGMSTTPPENLVIQTVILINRFFEHPLAVADLMQYWMPPVFDNNHCMRILAANPPVHSMFYKIMQYTQDPEPPLEEGGYENPPVFIP